MLLLGRAYESRPLSESAEILPISLPTLYRMLDLDKDMFTVYVVCPKCDSLYECHDCIKVLSNGTKESMRCCHVTMPNHPHRSRRVPCGAVLMKKQRTKKGIKIVPIKSYPYRSLKKSMGYLLNKIGLLKNVNIGEGDQLLSLVNILVMCMMGMYGGSSTQMSVIISFLCLILIY